MKKQMIEFEKLLQELNAELSEENHGHKFTAEQLKLKKALSSTMIDFIFEVDEWPPAEIDEHAPRLKNILDVMAEIRKKRANKAGEAGAISGRPTNPAPASLSARIHGGAKT